MKPNKNSFGKHIVRTSCLSVGCLMGMLQLSDPIFAQQKANAVNSYVEKFESKKRESNENTVVIVGGPTTGAYIKLIEDLQYVLDRRDTNEMRVLPVVGVSGIANLQDVLFLKNVDMCATESGYFDYLKAKDPILYADVDKKIQYITKLYDAEFHFLAKKDIKSLEDLRGKKVSLYLPLSSSAISGQELFKTLGIDVEVVYNDQAAATEKLKRGEIAAMSRLVAAPTTESFKDIKPEDGIHFIPIHADNITGGFSGRFGKVLKTFLPGQLKSEHYPNLIPNGEVVPTVASSVVLAVYAWPENTQRYSRVAKFVNAFFDNFDKLKDKKRNPKWQETNLAAEVPGWTRFKAAQQWLDSKRQQRNNVTETSSAVPIAAAFEAFLEEYNKRTGKNLTNTDMESLKRLFNKWQSEKEGG